MFNNMSNWALNKGNKDAIIYVHGNEIVRITVETFVKDGGSIAEFRHLKAESDAMFHGEDNLDVNENRNSDSFEVADQRGDCFAKSPEDLIVERIDRQIHHEYLATLKPIARQALEKLTEVQRRRYLLHVCEGLTTRRIAEIEGRDHSSIVESLQSADKKIKKFIQTFSN